jgi:hypothetical protein
MYMLMYVGIGIPKSVYWLYNNKKDIISGLNVFVY